MKTNRRESQVMAGIIAYLDTRTDFFYWRQNVSAGIAPSGQFMKVGVRGVADIIGVHAKWSGFGHPEGQFVAIEVKREVGGEQSPEQKRFEQNVTNHGGLYVLAHSVADVEDALGPVHFRVQKVLRQRVVPR